MNIAFIGAGRWALALAIHAHSRGHRVRLYEPSSALLDRLLNTRTHPDLPPLCRIPSDVTASNDPTVVLANSELVVFATPSSEAASAASSVAKLIPDSVHAVISVAKGIDPQTLQRISPRLQGILGRFPVVALAGPGIPYEFAAGDPTALVAASEHESAAELVRDTLTGGSMRIYSHSDVAGVELGAALKNVIALAAGIAAGINLGINARAALLTRGLAEIIRVGLALNCNPMTFAGLSGMGDLIVTAFSEHSRNYQLGLAVGRGTPVSQAIQQLNGVAEGVTTAKTGLALGRHLSVELPITEQVFKIIYEEAQPSDCLKQLFRRSPKREVWP